MILPEIEAAARTSYARLNAEGIPALVIGGMAVGAYANPRMTVNVDLLVPRAFLNSLPGTPLDIKGKTSLVNGIAVDIIGPPHIDGVRHSVWDEVFNAPRIVDDLPFVSLAGLILLKLHSNRVKDQSDIVEIIKMQQPAVAREVLQWLEGIAPQTDLPNDFERLMRVAESEKQGRRNPGASRVPMRRGDVGGHGGPAGSGW